LDDKDVEFRPSKVSASNPDPEPSTVLILVRTSDAVYEEEFSLFLTDLEGSC